MLETDQGIEVKTVNADAHGHALTNRMLVVARDAHTKYKDKIGRDPLVITATTDGLVSQEGLAALAALTETAHASASVAGPRLSLLAGFALCEAAARAYGMWYTATGHARASAAPH